MRRAKPRIEHDDVGDRLTRGTVCLGAGCPDDRAAKRAANVLKA